jgi:hypothetical protein
MITKHRNVTLNWTLNPTAFESINKDSLVTLTRPLGTAVTAVNKMLARAEEMELLLPDILGTSPQSNSGNWQASLSNYWHNFGLEVSANGQKFDTSFTFDLFDHRRQKYIDELVNKLNLNKTKKVKVVEGEEKFADIEVDDVEKLEKFATYVMTEVQEDLKYRYGHPANVADYLAWRYCLLSSDVGNDSEVMTKEGSTELKSTRIKFYLIDDDTITRNKAVIQKSRDKAITKLSDLISSKDNSKIDNILIAANKVYDLKGLKELSPDDKRGLLFDMTTSDPKKFVETSDDKNLNEVAEIKKFVMAALIRQLPNSTIYVDAGDPTIVLGNNIGDVVSYMAAPVNASYINELRLKMNQLMK